MNKHHEFTNDVDPHLIPFVSVLQQRAQLLWLDCVLITVTSVGCVSNYHCTTK